MTELTVVIPVGPKCRGEFVEDTLDSLDAFCPSGFRLFILDDSGSGLGAKLAAAWGGTALHVAYHGLTGGLYRSLSEAFVRALEHPFDVLLRLDTDALVAGSGFERRAHEIFTNQPLVGSLGSHRTNYYGEARSFRSTARRIMFMLTVGALVDRSRAMLLGRLVLRARINGYALGEHVMGGIALYSRAAIEALADADLLGDVALARTGLQEDHIFGLCLRAVGLELASFGSARDDLPLGVSWRGLPASPEELLARGKALVHSTKFYEERTENEIRAVFRTARARGVT